MLYFIIVSKNEILIMAALNVENENVYVYRNRLGVVTLKLIKQTNFLKKIVD